jgi:DNA-directed RNA polymerase III subunit RPC1
VKLDLNAISALKLEVTIETIRDSIIKTSKLKVKERHISLYSNDTLNIEPYDDSREKMYFVMQQLKVKLPHVIIKGIPLIVRAVISKSEKDKSKHQLLIEGYGLREVMRTPGIDYRYTTTNHILETCQVLGIEAARQTIINEIKYTMGSYGIHIDERHSQLLADEMTFKGQVLGITRFGVSKMKSSTLMLASFEMTTDHLYNSAVQCKSDDILGVSECIVMGN